MPKSLFGIKINILSCKTIIYNIIKFIILYIFYINKDIKICKLLDLI